MKQDELFINYCANNGIQEEVALKLLNKFKEIYLIADHRNKSKEILYKVFEYSIQFFRIKPINNRRYSEQVELRKYYCYYCRKKYKFPYSMIGEIINKDHATVLFAIKRMVEHLEVEKRTKLLYDEYEQFINEKLKEYED